MSLDKVTSRPWSYKRIEARDYGECQYSLSHNGSSFVCVGTCITREDDARHIVKCVNYHDRMAEELCYAQDALINGSHESQIAMADSINDLLLKIDGSNSEQQQ